MLRLTHLSVLHTVLVVVAVSTSQLSARDDDGDEVAGCGALAAHPEPTLLYNNHSTTTSTSHRHQQLKYEQQFTFGTATFALSFDAQSLALRNITSCAPGREQGFLWPAGPGATESFSLWQLNYSDCTAPTPGGSQLDALDSPSADRNHSIQQLPDRRQMLTLQWHGMATELPAVTMDVIVTVTMGAGSAQAALRGHIAVHSTTGHRVCIQSMALPNFERLVLRSPAQDRMFTPWFFGQEGDQSRLCGGGDCTLDLKGAAVMNGEHAFMPNGNERSMQWAALYSSPPSPAPPLGLYVGAHSTNADLMLLLMQGGYCPPPAPPNFKPNAYNVNSTLRHGVDSGSEGGDMPNRKGLDNLTSWSECAHKCGENRLCRAWVWNSKTLDCYPKFRVGIPKHYGPDSTPDIYGCSPGYPVSDCVNDTPGPPPPITDDCGSFAGMRWLHFPENSINSTTSWTILYDVVLAGFLGDWWDAAMIYRAWALSDAVWTKAGNLTQRVATDSSYPSWLLQAPLWTQMWSNPAVPQEASAQIPENIRLANALGVPIGTHWYGWNDEQFDTHYPVYTPRAGFANATSTMQSADPPVHVVPYTNGRLFDPRSSKWTTDNASRFACHRFDPSSEGCEGSPYTEKYEASFNWSQQVMDPGSMYWQDTISAAVGSAHRAGNTSGVYVDQIASMYASSCYGHGQSGGGSRWANGNRATLQKAAKAIGPGKVLISESNAEAYLSSLHAYLAIYGWRECGVVPAFQAVYGGWSVNIGGVSWPTDIQGIRMYLAQQFTFGHVMGWTSPATFLKDNATLAYTRQLAQLKVKHSMYLVFGRLMHPPEISSATGGALPELRWCSNTCCSTQIVIGQVWMASDGSLGLAIANPSNVTALVVAKVRVDGHTHLKAGIEAEVDGNRITAGVAHLEVHKTLAPLSAALVRISRCEDTKQSIG